MSTPLSRWGHMRDIPWFFWLCHPGFLFWSLWCGARDYHRIVEADPDPIADTDTPSHYCATCGACLHLVRSNTDTQDDTMTKTGKLDPDALEALDQDTGLGYQVAKATVSTQASSPREQNPSSPGEAQKDTETHEVDSSPSTHDHTLEREREVLGRRFNANLEEAQHLLLHARNTLEAMIPQANALGNADSSSCLLHFVTRCDEMWYALHGMRRHTKESESCYTPDPNLRENIRRMCALLVSEAESDSATESKSAENVAEQPPEAAPPSPVPLDGQVSLREAISCLPRYAPCVVTGVYDSAPPMGAMEEDAQGAWVRWVDVKNIPERACPHGEEGQSSPVTTPYPSETIAFPSDSLDSPQPQYVSPNPHHEIIQRVASLAETHGLSCLVEFREGGYRLWLDGESKETISVPSEAAHLLAPLRFRLHCPKPPTPEIVAFAKSTALHPRWIQQYGSGENKSLLFLGARIATWTDEGIVKHAFSLAQTHTLDSATFCDRTGTPVNERDPEQPQVLLRFSGPSSEYVVLPLELYCDEFGVDPFEPSPNFPRVEQRDCTGRGSEVVQEEVLCPICEEG